MSFSHLEDEVSLQSSLRSRIYSSTDRSLKWIKSEDRVFNLGYTPCKAYVVTEVLLILATWIRLLLDPLWSFQGSALQAAYSPY